MVRWVAFMVVLVVLSGCSQTSKDGHPTEPLYTPPPPDNSTLDPRVFLNATTVTKSYAAVGVGPWAFNTGCDPLWDPGGPSNIGGACFVLEEGTQFLEFQVTDDIAASVGVYVRYDDGPSGFFCNAGTLETPSTASWFMVIMQEFACALQQKPGASTTGSIEVTMYHS